MSCGGSMMRASFQPLAHLVDAAAERWLAAENAEAQEQKLVYNSITQRFHIGDQPELTLHGLKYLLTITRSPDTQQGEAPVFTLAVHEIAISG